MFCDHNLLHDIALADLVDDVETFDDFAEYGVVTVEVGGVLAAVADEKLGATGVAAGVGHGQYAAVVILVIARQFAVDLIAGAAIADAIGAAALDHEIGDDTVKGQAIIKALFSEGNEVFNSIGGIFFKEVDLHNALFGVNFGYFHSLSVKFWREDREGRGNGAIGISGIGQ